MGADTKNPIPARTLLAQRQERGLRGCSQATDGPLRGSQRHPFPPIIYAQVIYVRFQYSDLGEFRFHVPALNYSRQPGPTAAYEVTDDQGNHGSFPGIQGIRPASQVAMAVRAWTNGGPGNGRVVAVRPLHTRLRPPVGPPLRRAPAGPRPLVTRSGGPGTRPLLSGQDWSYAFPQWRVCGGWRRPARASVSQAHRLRGIRRRHGTRTSGPDYPWHPAIPRIPWIRRRPVCAVASPKPGRPGPCSGCASLETSAAVTPFPLPFPARNPLLPCVALRLEGTVFACRTDPGWNLVPYRVTHC